MHSERLCRELTAISSDHRYRNVHLEKVSLTGATSRPELPASVTCQEGPVNCSTKSQVTLLIRNTLDSFDSSDTLFPLSVHSRARVRVEFIME